MNAAAKQGVSARELAFGLFMITFSVTIGSNVGLAVVLERSGPEALPLLTIVNAVLLGGATATVALAGRGAALRGLGVTLVVGAVLVAICAAGEVAHARWSAWGLYLGGSIVGDLSAALFWSLANEHFDARGAKRVFPRVGAAGTAGGAVSGLVTHAAAAWLHLGAIGLVALWFGSLLAAAGWALLTARRSTSPSSCASRSRTAPGRAREDRALVAALSLGLVVVIAVTLVGRFLYARALADTYGADVAAIAAANGLLLGIASVATALVQLFVTPFLLARWGVKGVIFVYPVFLLATFALLGFRFGLASGIVAFFVTAVLRRAVQGPIESILPTALVPAHAGRTILLLTAVSTPLGMVLAGVALELGSTSSRLVVSMLGACLTALLVVVGMWRARTYRASLRLRLAKGGADLHRRLARTMMSSAREVHALLHEELRTDDPSLFEKLETLVRMQRESERAGAAIPRRPWDRTSSLVKIVEARLAEAWRMQAALARMPTALPIPGLLELWRGAVRYRIALDVRTAILALRAATHRSELDRISTRLFDADPRARSAAVELLDGLCPHDVRPVLIPLVEGRGGASRDEKASRRFGRPSPDPIVDLLAVPDPWLRACTAYAIAELDPSPYKARLRELGAASDDPFLLLAVAHAQNASSRRMTSLLGMGRTAPSSA